MNEIARKRLERQLRQKVTAEEIRGGLLWASLFLVAYELLKIQVLGKTGGLFVKACDEWGRKYSPGYKADVVGLDRDQARVSPLWLMGLGALRDLRVPRGEQLARPPMRMRPARSAQQLGDRRGDA